jgi:hypothetical protein
VTLDRPEEAAAFKRRLRAFCGGRLAPVKVPVKVEIAAGEQHGARYKRRPGALRGGGVAGAGP